MWSNEAPGFMIRSIENSTANMKIITKIIRNIFFM